MSNSKQNSKKSIGKWTTEFGPCWPTLVDDDSIQLATYFVNASKPWNDATEVDLYTVDFNNEPDKKLGKFSRQSKARKFAENYFKISTCIEII
ncbi:MAG: hypothetical protein ACE5HX_05065 [bacterium]